MAVKQTKPPKADKPEIKPARELKTKDGYRWFYYDEDQIGLGLVGIENPETGLIATTTIVNPKKRVAAHRAWAGARQSRAAGMPWEILAEMGEKGVDPDEKLDGTFKGYGHASVGDMARIPVDLSNAPMHLLFALFNISSINSGQEKSSRYQKRFGRAVIHRLTNYLSVHLSPPEVEFLDQAYQAIAQAGLDYFNKYKETLTKAYTDYYKPTENDAGAMTARILDSARFFLPFGAYSGICLETSARDWARIIAELKASPITYYHQVGDQIQKLLTPTKEEEEKLGFRAEAPSLIRHTEPADLTNDNLAQLKKYLLTTDLFDIVPLNTEFRRYVPHQVELLSPQVPPIERLVCQYILTLWPGLNHLKLLSWIKDQSDEIKQSISQRIFTGHSNYRELAPIAKTTGLTVVFRGYLGEIRDLNRHRAWGRFAPLPLVYGLKWDYSTVKQIIAKGYGLPLYLVEVPEFAEIGTQFLADMEEYYGQLMGFVDQIKSKYGEEFDYSFVVNLLPMGHQVDLWMHGDAKQALYLTFQRTRPGGHINYRDLAYRANLLIATSSPYLKASKLPNPPQPGSREEFLDRS